MSEAIAEMVLPGTYIEVRSEGLIAVGASPPATSASSARPPGARSPRCVPIGSAAEAIDIFGPADNVSAPAEAGEPPLSLVRALQQVFAGGGSNVFAVRIAGGTPDRRGADRAGVDGQRRSR